MLYRKNQSRELDLKLFKNPTSEYRGAPFWAWNCKMNKEMAAEQIEFLKKMGFGGFHIHSRSGMAMPYLKDEFMELVKFCVARAKELDMYAYLYDEDRWPSGAAGGYVTSNPKYRMRRLEFSTGKEEHYPENTAYLEGKNYLLAVYDITLNDKGELVEYKKINENDSAKGTKWYAYIKTAEREPWYNNQTAADLLNKEAVDKFIDITYSAYEKAVGGEFSKTVLSIFTDEAQFARKLPHGFKSGEKISCLPWTFSFSSSFEKKYKYNLCDKLPEVVCEREDGLASLARYHYHEHVCNVFNESFIKNCVQWCHGHGLRFTGHMIGENSLWAQTITTGDVMRAYKDMDIPGIDLLCDWIEFQTLKQCQSVVRQFGKEAMIGELYGVTGWDFDYRGHKFQGDWLTALGVNIRTPHLSWDSMKGEAKRDFPATINYQSPWAGEYKYIEDHFARLSTVLTRGRTICHVAVIHPVESYWIYYGPDENTLEKRKDMDKKITDLVEWLLLGGIDFDFVSEILLSEQNDEISDVFRVGNMTYSVVIIPNCITLRRTTWNKLVKFAKNGGNVIVAGKYPAYLDAVPHIETVEIFQQLPYDRLEILTALERYREVEIKRNNVFTDNLIYTLREDRECKWMFIAHAKKAEFIDDTSYEEIEVKVKGIYTPTVYNTLNGNIYGVDFSVCNGQTVMSFRLYQSDSLLLRLDNNNTYHAKKESDKLAPIKTIRFNKSEYYREEPNVLLLDRAFYSLDDEPWQQEEEILKLDNICRKRLGWAAREASRVQPWTEEEKEPEHFIRLKFIINSETTVQSPMLAIEEIENISILHNGVKVMPNACGYFADKAIKTIALPNIESGRNELIVKIPFGKCTNTEWCYILGDFNVRNDGVNSVIYGKSAEIGFGSITTKGMPFYGGNIIYRVQAETEECNIRIHVNCYRGALVRVAVDGEDKGVIAFSPYTLDVDDLERGRHIIEFKLFGTRVNTFGGMHNVLQPKWIDPNFWRTEGDGWCYEYKLKEQGIMASPIIEIFNKT